MSNPTQIPGFDGGQAQNPGGSFDDTLAKTADDLNEFARDILTDDEVKKALEDEGRDDAW